MFSWILDDTLKYFEHFNGANESEILNRISSVD